MKKLLIPIFVFISFSLVGQTYAGLTYSPPKRGVGVLVVKDIKDKLSCVCSFESGKYGDIKLNKYGAGLKYSMFMALWQYNHMSDEPFGKVYKNSLEIGFSGEFTKDANVIMLYDCLNKETRFGFTVSLW